MRDNTPRNKEGKPHGYWIVHHNNNNLWFDGYFLNGLAIGFFEFRSWDNEKSRKIYHAN